MNNMKRQLTKTEKLLLSILLVVVLLYGGYQLVGKLSGNLDEKYTQLEVLRGEKERVEIIISQREQTQKKYDATFDDILLRLDSWFNRLEQTQLFSILEQVEENTGIEIIDVRFEQINYEELYNAQTNSQSEDKDVFLELAKQYEELMGKSLPAPSQGEAETKATPEENVTIKSIRCNLSFLCIQSQLFDFMEEIENNPRTIHIKELRIALAEEGNQREESPVIQVDTELLFYYIINPFVD